MRGMQNCTAESPAYRLVLYITHMQRTATEESSMQREGNAVCRVRGMQSEGNAVYRMRRMQYAERGECSMQGEGNAVCRVRGMECRVRGMQYLSIYYTHTTHGNRGM